MVDHAFKPNIWEAETGRSVSLRSAWSTLKAPGQPVLHSETLLQNQLLVEVGKMPQWLRALDALPENPGGSSSTAIVIHVHLVPGNPTLSLF